MIEPIRLRDGRALAIRRLRAGDGTQFNSFMRAIADESSHTLRYPGQPESDPTEIAARWESAAASREKLYLGALDGGALKGYLMCFRVFPDHPWMKHIGYFVLMTLKEYWGAGLGRELLRGLDAHALETGITKIEAGVRTDNPRAIDLYLKCGFHIEGLRRHAAQVDGAYRDEYYIAKFY